MLNLRRAFRIKCASQRTEEKPFSQGCRPAYLTLLILALGPSIRASPWRELSVSPWAARSQGEYPHGLQISHLLSEMRQRIRGFLGRGPDPSWLRECCHHRLPLLWTNILAKEGRSPFFQCPRKTPPLRASGTKRGTNLRLSLLRQARDLHIACAYGFVVGGIVQRKRKRPGGFL